MSVSTKEHFFLPVTPFRVERHPSDAFAVRFMCVRVTVLGPQNAQTAHILAHSSILDLQNAQIAHISAQSVITNPGDVWSVPACSMQSGKHGMAWHGMALHQL